MSKSTHRVEIVPVLLEKHPNADNLSIVHVHGYQVVVRTEDWDGCEAIFSSKRGEMACFGAYIPPDSLVPLHKTEFEFLKNPNKPDQKFARIKAKRLRGEWSMGLLIHAPVGRALAEARWLQAGDDVADLLGVEHYEPPEPMSTGGETESPPAGAPPVYDVEAFRRYGREAFEPGEHVFVSEKIHGTNGRWMFDGERFHCGSRTEWKRVSQSSVWWRALEEYPALQNFLFMNPGTVVYGEVYGMQDLKYGRSKGQIGLAVFDILHKGKWVDAADQQSFQPNPEGPPAFTLPWVPLIASCEFDFDLMLNLAEGHTLIPGADHIREGIVVRPLRERWNSHCGRVNLKVVANQYLERA